MAERRPIKLAPTLALPLDAITQTFGIFGLKGSGKSSTGATFVEQGVAVGGRFVIADPTGVWWGLMHDGVGPGLPGIVFGGEHADVPLESTAGHIVAEFVVQQDAYPVVVLDMKLMRKADRTKFMLHFLETLYHDNREALHVVLDEAGQFAPTQARDGGNTIPLLGAVEDVVALGRSRGLGITMISQRFATLNANVREQIGTLVAHQLVGSLDRKALKGWVEAQADPTREKEMVEGIAKLDVGRALVWSPAFLKFFGIVDINAPVTFDSRATPKVGQRVKKPGKRANVDLGVLRERMAATIIEAEANDPKRLKQRLAQAEALARKQAEEIDRYGRDLTDLEQRMAAIQKQIDEEKPEVVVLDVPPLTELRELLDRFIGTRKEVEEILSAINSATLPLNENVKTALDAVERQARATRDRPAAPPRVSATTQRQPPPTSSDVGKATRSVPGAAPDTGASGGATTNGSVTDPEQRVLDALAWFETLQVPTPSRIQVGFVAGYKVSKKGGGTFAQMLADLRSRDLIQAPAPGMVALTDHGRTLAQDPGLGYTNEAMHDAVLDRLSEPERRVLRVLIDAYPEPVTRIDLGTACGYTVTAKGGGTFAQMVANLITLALVDKAGPGKVAASKVLFPLG